jgi:multidrug efflux system membrane fusion protein
MRRFAVSLLSLGALAAIAGCGKPADDHKAGVSVTAATVQQGPAPYVVTANGIIEPIQTVAVQSQVQGVLTGVRFKEGDDVHSGDVLFEIDPRPFQAALDQARASLARDVAQAASARRDADRYAALVAKDFVTRSQADQAEANAVAQLAVVRADSAAVASAQFNLDNCTIRAPIDGRTGYLYVRRGNLVRPGSVPPLVVINQIHPIAARFAVPDRELARVQQYLRQHPLKVTANTAQSSGGIEGTLDFIDNGVDTTTGTITLKARFANGENALWPGQFVAVALELYVQPDAILVPTSAVQPAQDSGQFVFVVDRENKAQMTPVAAGRAVGDFTVINRGLAAGERVVTDGQSRLTPGALVEVRSIDSQVGKAAADSAGAAVRAAAKAPDRPQRAPAAAPDPRSDDQRARKQAKPRE